MPKYLIVFVSHSEESLSEIKALSHALEKVNRGYAITTKVAERRGSNPWGRGLRSVRPFPLSDVADDASAVFLTGDTVRTSG